MGNMLQVIYRSCGRDGMPSIVVGSILLLEYFFLAEYWRKLRACISPIFVDGTVLAARIVTRVLYWALWWV